jgi:hypothetical protein
MLFWAIVFIAAAVVLYAIIMFNSLVRTRQMANEAWSGIDCPAQAALRARSESGRVRQRLCHARSGLSSKR